MGRVRGAIKGPWFDAFYRLFLSLLKGLQVPPPSHGLGVGTQMLVDYLSSNIVILCWKIGSTGRFRARVGALKGHYWPIGDPALE